MNVLRPLCYFLAASLTGCGAMKNHTNATADAVAWSSDSLFGSYEKQSSGSYFHHAVVAVASLPLNFLGGGEGQLRIKDFSVDGLALKGEAAPDLDSRLKLLNQRYATLGDLWQANGFDASLPVPRSQFLAGIKAMSSKEKALAAGLKAPFLRPDQQVAVLAAGMVFLTPLLETQVQLQEANAQSLALQGNTWSYPWGGHIPSCQMHPDLRPPRCVIVKTGIVDTVESGINCPEGIDPSCAIRKGIAQEKVVELQGQSSDAHKAATQQTKQYLDRSLQRNAIPTAQLGDCTQAIATAGVSANYKVINRIPYTCIHTDTGFQWSFSDI